MSLGFTDSGAFTLIQGYNIDNRRIVPPDCPPDL